MITSSLAEGWDVDSTATKYTFYIRQGVKFTAADCFENGQGREVTAHDFKYSLDKLCEASPNNQGFWVFKAFPFF